MGDPEPLSVLMPVRDGASTIALALRDILGGIAVADEVVVINDGSQDGTADLLSAAAASDSRIRVVETRGLGLVGALTLGLNEVSHRIVARADADDRYPRDRFERQRAAMVGDVALVTGDYAVTVGGRTIGDIPCALTDPFVAASLIHPQRIPHPGVMYDKDAVIAAGGYIQGDFPAEDLGLWLRLGSVGRMVGVPHRTVKWAMSKTSITHQNQTIQRQKTEQLLVQSARRLPMARLTPDAVAEELNLYGDTRLAALRRLLLARDLKSLGPLGVDTAALCKALWASAQTPFSSSQAAYQLIRDRRRRQRIR